MTNKAIEYNLEGLRGLAALIVVFGHLFFRNNFLDPSFNLSLPGNYIPPGHFSVLIFFCLSGFVIGYTNRNALSSWHETGQYLKKRFIRLYPIYVISILVVLPMAFTFTEKGVLLLVKYLTFSNVLFAEGYPQNNPLWSLNYEVLYYLLFIPLSFFRFPKIPVIVAALIVAVLNLKMHTRFNHPLISSYLFGLIFWLTGSKISEYASEKREKPVSNGFLLGNFLLVLCLPAFVNALLLKFNFSYFKADKSFPWVFRAITFSDLFILPFCVYFILTLVNIRFPFRRYAIAWVCIFPLLVTFFKLWQGNGIQELIIPLCLYAISLPLILFTTASSGKLTGSLMRAIIYSGSISYAVYVLHFPLLTIFHSVKIFGGTLLTAGIRMALFFAILLPVCILLENYLQPRIKKLLIGKQERSPGK